jgi:hypothetical protein
MLPGCRGPNCYWLPPLPSQIWATGIWLVALLLGAYPFDNRPGADDTGARPHGAPVCHAECQLPIPPP